MKVAGPGRMSLPGPYYRCSARPPNQDVGAAPCRHFTRGVSLSYGSKIYLLQNVIILMNAVAPHRSEQQNSWRQPAWRPGLMAKLASRKQIFALK